MCLGKHHMNSDSDGPTEVCVPVEAIISHEDFIYPQNNDVSNDIALVRLAKAITVTPEISPVCLPKPESVMPAGHVCYVTGWGDEKGWWKQRPVYLKGLFIAVITSEGIYGASVVGL